MTTEPRPASWLAASAPSRLEHEPALDGLRGAAVLIVLGYHLSVAPGAGPLQGVLTGGFVGVDVFFVLSGYLITSLLLIDRAHRGRTVTLDFWRRRARRLLPAMFVLLALAAVYAALAAEPWQVDGIRRTGIAALLYVSNWYIVVHHAATTGVLSHTWSLAIEEQWYLVWPLLLGGLLVLVRGRRWALGAVVVVLAVSSAIAMTLLFDADGWIRAYHGTDSRAWELLAGAGLAIAFLGRVSAPSKAPRRATDALAIAGVGALALVAVVATPFDAWMYHGGFVVVVVAAMAIVVAAARYPEGAVAPVLSWRPLTLVGLISYGLYLYQVPVIAYLRPEEVGLSGWPLVGLRVAVILLLSVLSYLYVEMPVRRGVLSRSRRALVLAPIAAVSAVGLLLVATAGGTPIPATEQRAQFYESVALGSGKHVRVMVAGTDDVFTLGSAGAYRGDGVLGLAVPLLLCDMFGGRLVIGSFQAPDQGCAHWERALRLGVDHFRPRVAVLIVGRQAVFDRVVGARTLLVGTAELARLLRGDLERARRVLTRHGAVMVLASVPCPFVAAAESPAIASVRTDPARRAWVNKVWTEFATAHPKSVSVADLSAVLCPEGDANPRAGGGTVRSPDGRLSPAGIRAVWTWVAAQSTRVTKVMA